MSALIAFISIAIWYALNQVAISLSLDRDEKLAENVAKLTSQHAGFESRISKNSLAYAIQGYNNQLVEVLKAFKALGS